MKPGAKLLIVGVVLLVLGFIVIPIFCVIPLVFAKQETETFLAPGVHRTTVEEPGQLSLWHDHHILYKGVTYHHEPALPHGMEIHVRDAGGRELPLEPSTGVSSTSGMHESVSIATFRLASPGALTIEVTGGDADYIFSLHRGGLLDDLKLILFCLISSSLLSAAGVGILIWGAVKLLASIRAGKLPTTPL